MGRLFITVLVAGAILAASVSAPAQTKSSGQKKGQTTKKNQTTKKSQSGGSGTTSKKTTTQSGANKGTGTANKAGQGAKAGGQEPAKAVEKPVDYGALPLAKLLNGKDLTGWHLRHADGKNAWRVENGVLINGESGTDLVTDAKFTDFELHLEFNVPASGNSGVYLQGRYEVQVADSAGVKELNKSMMGAIYSKAAPLVNSAKPAGEWQTLDIHFMQAVKDATGAVLLKPTVTIILNDELIADRLEIDGVTGGALDSEEGTPGPLMLQGDHTAVQYRNIILRQLPPRKAPEAEPEEDAAPPAADGK